MSRYARNSAAVCAVLALTAFLAGVARGASTPTAGVPTALGLTLRPWLTLPGSALPGSTLPGLPGVTLPGWTGQGWWRPGSALPGSALPGSTLPGSTLPGSTLPGSTLPGSALPGSTLPGSTLPGSALPGSTLPGSTLPGLPGVTLPGWTGQGWWRPGSTLPGSTLPGSTLPGSTLPGSTLPGSTLPGSTLPGSTSPGSTPATPPTSAPPTGGTSGQAGLSGTVVNDSFTNAAGTRKYQVYVPSSYKAGTAMPLVVALHGCTEQIDVFRQLTALDKLAESKGFVVVFPGQTPSANQQNCWNWFKSGDMQRDSGESSIIAGITQAIQQRYSIDTKRTYVLGFSAGGAMATVMGASYPDLYAAVGSGSGCEYNGLPCVGSPGPDPVTSGQAAYQAMGAHARPMPVIVFQGDADTTVVPANGDRVVREWQTTDDLADDGSINGSIPLAPTSTVNKQVPGGHSYTVTTYGNGHGGELIQYWVVHGMNHAWSGGCSCEQYADPAGPNESQAMVDFFLRHSLN